MCIRDRPHALPSFSDRSTLWNSVELYEKAGNAQLAREIDAALPVELSREEQIRLVREYCSSQFVSRGMCVDFAIHDTGSGNPHCHIMLTMRPLDERGAWAAKSKKEYDLDENGERIRLPSGRYKTHKVDLTGWNDKGNALLWRKAWEMCIRDRGYAMNQMEIFSNQEFGSIRTFEQDGKVLFCGKDIAKALGYQRTADAITAHCKGVCVLPTPSNGGIQRMKFIPEGDVYRLIVHSKLPSAERFERWVFDEVLPSIRKHGAYITREKLWEVATSPEAMMKLCSDLLAEREENAVLRKENAMDTSIFLGGKEPTTLKELAAMLGKETIDTYNTGESRGRETSHSLNYQKLGKRADEPGRAGRHGRRQVHPSAARCAPFPFG